MATPLKFSKSGIPHRTARTIARSAGGKIAKLPPLPSDNGYCAAHGTPHDMGGCDSGKKLSPAEEISRAGGSAKLPVNIKPFKLGGV